MEENSSITQVHPHSPSVWQTIQRHSAAGDRRKRRVAESVSDTEVKIQTSSRQRQLAVPHPAPSPPPLAPPLLGWQKKCTSAEKQHQLIHPQYLEGKAYLFFTQSPLSLPFTRDSTRFACSLSCVTRSFSMDRADGRRPDSRWKW